MNITSVIKAILLLCLLFLFIMPRVRHSNSFFTFILRALSIYFIACYFIVVSFRIFYPFQLSIWEGVTLNQSCQILLHNSMLYSKPSIKFTAYIYTPLYYYISSLFMKLFGIGFLAPRMLSFVSSLGCFLIIYLLVKKETQNNLYPILAIGLFAATFGIDTNFSSWIWVQLLSNPTKYDVNLVSGGFLDHQYRYLDAGFGGWLDTANVDSLFLFLFLFAIFFARNSSKYYSPFGAGILLALAFFTKQPALLFAPFLLLFYLIESRRQFVMFFTSFLSVVSSVSLFFIYKTQNWFHYFVVFKYKQLYFSISPPLKDRFLFSDVFASLPFISIGILLFFLLNGKSFFKNDYNGKKLRFFFIMSLGVFCISWFGRSHCGGDNNILLPMYAIFSIVFCFACQSFFRFVDGTKNRAFFRSLIHCLISAQFVIFFYNPTSLIPNATDQQAGKHLLDIIGSFDGDVFIPFHNYLPASIGKESYAHGPGLLTVLTRSDPTYYSVKPAEELRCELEALIRRRSFDALITDEYPFLFRGTRHVRENEEWFFLVSRDCLERYYEPSRKVFSQDLQVFFPTTAWLVRPSTIYVPKRSEVSTSFDSSTKITP